MKVIVTADYTAMSATAAGHIVEHVQTQPDLLLCAASGETPAHTYALLHSHADRFRHVRVLKLDEWGGLAMDDPGTCEETLQRQLIRPLAVSPDRFHGFASDSADPPAECRRLQQWLREHGPIDLCILGLGANGHLAFNEPAPSLQPFSHVAELAACSQRHAMTELARRKPAYGMTIGIADILASRHILLLVSGIHKRDLFCELLSQRIDTQVPASFLWLHQNVTCICDTDVADGIVNRAMVDLDE